MLPGAKAEGEVPDQFPACRHPYTASHVLYRRCQNSQSDKPTQAISFLIVIAVARTIMTKWLLSGDNAFSCVSFPSDVATNDDSHVFITCCADTRSCTRLSPALPRFLLSSFLWSSAKSNSGHSSASTSFRSSGWPL